MDYKENIKNNIKNLEQKINKYDNKLKILQIFYRFIAMIHVGSAGPFAVNALKDLLSGNIFGIFAFLGLIASAGTWYFIFSSIQNSIQSKKEEATEKMVKLENIQNEINRSEKYQKTKANNITNNIKNNITYEENIKLNMNNKLSYKLRLKK